MGQFQMIGATKCGVTSADATFLETQGDTGVNFTGDINNVFACLGVGFPQFMRHPKRLSPLPI
jgi:hypothetical protein